MDEKDPAPAPAAETLDQLHARHRKELRDLQSRVTQKKKNATKKTRKGVNDECAELERLLKEKHAEEIRTANGEGPPPEPEPEPVDDDELVPAMQAASISPPPPPPPAQKEKEKEGGPGQKQNRHRARLARRAAEAAAASEAAASEAAAQPDRRAAERAAMERAFKENSLREKDIEPDGHCLFSAVADQLGAAGIELAPAPPSPVPAYKVVRHRAAEYMTKHADDFAGFLEEPVGEYAARIRDTAEWGGELELSALARAYGVEIRVVQDGRTEVVAPFEEGEGGRKTLWLAYYRHGYGLGEHYNSLRSVKGGD
ncbi:otu-like cysteine protease [Podospora conica]|nr:otu-like cysteine protease [Schizothecium conicum]